MKNVLEGLNRRCKLTEESANLKICQLHHLRKLTKFDEQKEKRMKKKTTEPWEPMGDKQAYQHMHNGLSEEEETKRIFEELMVKSFPKLMKNTNPYIMELQQTPSRMNLKDTYVESVQKDT